MHKLKVRVLRVIKEHGDKGATRSRIMQKLNCTKYFLDEALLELLASNVIFQKQDPKPARGLAPIRFYSLEQQSVVEERLTKATSIATVTPQPTDPGTFRSTVRTCVQCGTVLPEVEGRGRPPIYCSEDCKVAANENPGLRQFLESAEDEGARVRACLFVVAADLILRGFEVALPVSTLSIGKLFAYDATGSAIQIKVFVVGPAGIVPDTTNVESAAVVYRDGRIEYVGKTPLVVEAEAAEDPLVKVVREDLAAVNAEEIVED
jgi:hypothetical protein